MSNKNKIDKNFVSDIDKKLAEFDRTHPKSPSQLAEIKKHLNVAKRRDQAIDGDAKKDIWK